MHPHIKDNPEDIIIIRESKDIFGNIVVLYVRRDQPDLKRIKIKGDD